MSGHVSSDLFHYAGLAFRKRYVSSRLVLDEFDLNLSPFASFVIVAIIVGSSSIGRAPLAFYAALLASIGVVAVFIDGCRLLLRVDNVAGHVVAESSMMFQV